MVRAILLVFVFLYCSMTYSQISTYVAGKPKVKEESYDSLESLCYTNAKRHVGQRIFVKGTSYNRKTGGYYNKFKVKPNVFSDVYMPNTEGETDYNAITGKYFTITKVEDKGIVKGLWLTLTDSVDVIYMNINSYDIEKDYYVTVGYYEKMKDLLVGKTFITKDEGVTLLETGEKKNVPVRVRFKCIDVGVSIGEDGSVFAVLENERYGKTRAKIVGEKKKCLVGYTDLDRYNRLVKRFGENNANYISEGRIKIGMTKTMVEEAWGLPDDVNSTRGIYGSHEQWVYGNRCIYFEGNRLTTIQD